MKVLVCGASGILGRNLCNTLRRQNISFLGTYFQNQVEDSVFVDFSVTDENEHSIQSVVQSFRPTVLVNCVVERFVDVCEQDWNATKACNITIAQKLAKVCAEHGIYLIHISTDYVFDGKKPPYYPSSQPNPLQNYGISKLIAEYRVCASAERYTIIRVPVLYTDLYRTLSETAVTVIGKKVMNRMEKNMKEDAVSIRRPVYIPDLCDFIRQLVERPATNKIVHFYNTQGLYTKYDIAKMIGEILEKDTTHILPQTTFSDGDMSERPIDTELIDDSCFVQDYHREETSLKEGLVKCFQRFAHTPFHLCTSDDVFIMLDLDGTLINSEPFHYQCYQDALHYHGIQHTNFTYGTFLDICNDPKKSTDEYFQEILGLDADMVARVRKTKVEMMEMDTTTAVSCMDGMEDLMDIICTRNLPHVVVTNTSRPIVEVLKRKVPALCKLKNWITREDYDRPKPDADCYQKAKQLYYQNQKATIVIENSWKGMLAAKKVTDIVYVITTKTHPYYRTFQKEDVYLFEKFGTHV